MGIIKGPKAHALVVHDGRTLKILNPNRKEKERCMQSQRRKGTPNPSMIPQVPKVEKESKGRSVVTAIMWNHPESACMKKKIDLMVQILQKNNLRDFIPEAAKKKSEDQAPKKGNPHALVAIHSSPDAWIVDSGASHHMETTKDILSFVTACMGPPILMGDDSPVEVTEKGEWN
jgi:hypothetical protein